MTADVVDSDMFWMITPVGMRRGVPCPVSPMVFSRGLRTRSMSTWLTSMSLTEFWEGLV